MCSKRVLYFRRLDFENSTFSGPTYHIDVFVTQKQINIKNTLKYYRLYCILPAYEYCIRSLLQCIFKIKLELTLCLFAMVLSSLSLRSLFTDMHIFYEMFFSVFNFVTPSVFKHKFSCPILLHVNRDC